jgi:MoaA/NifB/PqqE/SkfB family radical SAM enzyme
MPTPISSPSARPTLNLSLNPSYYCNFRCDFCYLTKAQLGDKRRLTLSRLFERVDEVLSVADVGMVDLYGGEPLLLPEAYLDELKMGLHARGIDDLNIITNLSMNNPVVHDPDWYVSVSYDFEAREKHEHVFQQMLKMQRPFAILMLASPELMAKDVGEIIDTLNLLAQLESVEVKPYSSNQANQLAIGDEDYEDFIKRLMAQRDRMNFTFVNAHAIEESLSGRRNAFSNDHVYLTPSGQFGVLEFDDNLDEYFLELDSIDAYFDWAAWELTRVSASACGSCEYFGRCLSEHLRPVTDVERSCNGFYKLLRWAEGYG